MTIRSIALLALACAAAGCGRSFVSPAPNALTLEARRSRTPIQHVVYIVQENRSFNNLFEGFPNALTASYGYDSKGKKIELRPHALGTEWDVGHSSLAYFTACDGQGKLKGTDCKMDGWLG
ncbi:MAG: hypothetical protein WBX23_05545, partial [Candidatus Cybelea sp.]